MKSNNAKGITKSKIAKSTANIKITKASFKFHLSATRPICLNQA